jgi:hypothetical protein
VTNKGRKKKESRAATLTIFKVAFKPSYFARGLRWDPLQNARKSK